MSYSCKTARKTPCGAPDQKFNRRAMLKGAAASTGLLAAPGIVTNALASSGELNILMWSDYLPEEFITGFQAETGIKLNYTRIGSNEEIIDRMKATKGRLFDLVSPTNFRSPQWQPLDLLQPFDMNRVPADRVNPAMMKIGETAWSFGGQGVYWLPHIWGTEGIGWRTDLWTLKGEAPSYGDVWSDETKGRTMGRPHSMMLGAGLYMETIGELEPGALWLAYENEQKMRPVWDKIAAWCIARRAHIKRFWNKAEAQKKGFLEDGVILGQTWDGPPIALKNDGKPVTYQAPKEGAMAWVDGLALSSKAENVDQVYAFIEFAYRPEPAGKAIDRHGYNSPVRGADKFASAQYGRNFSEAYPGDALAKLIPWPAEPPWYADIRTEYARAFVNSV
ncbi:MAG: extracellular solute-binding protein [Hyphomicrobiales bacterium]